MEIKIPGGPNPTIIGWDSVRLAPLNEISVFLVFREGGRGTWQYGHQSESRCLETGLTTKKGAVGVQPCSKDKVKQNT